MRGWPTLYFLSNSAFTSLTPFRTTSVLLVPRRSAHSCIRANSSGASRISRRSVFLLLVGRPVRGDKESSPHFRPYIIYNICTGKSQAHAFHTSLYFPRRCGIIRFTRPPGLVPRVLVLLSGRASTLLFFDRFDSKTYQLQQRIPRGLAELLNFRLFLWRNANVEPLCLWIFNLRPALGRGHWFASFFVRTQIVYCAYRKVK